MAPIAKTCGIVVVIPPYLYMRDVGGDFYNTGRGGMAWHNETWSIPTDDLEQIYKSMNLPNESSQKIFECTLTMYLGSIL